MNDLHYAVVVGINRYPGVRDLSGARRDADDFAAWLLEPQGGGLLDGNVKRITATKAEENGMSARTARPTSVDIEYAIQEITTNVQAELAKDPAAWDRTRLYIYVAGHGFAPRGGEGALVLANAEPGAWSRNVELAKYREWLTACAWFREVVIFADCCRTRVAQDARPFPPQLDECPTPWNGKSSAWVVGFGSILGRPTYETTPADVSDDDARGYFTAALLEGLRGGAPPDPNTGAITAATLSGYVKSIVAERTRGLRFPQEADINGPLANTVVLTTPAQRATRAVTIAFPPGFGGMAQLHKDGHEVAAWNAGNGEWQIELTDGLYEVTASAPAAVTFVGDGLFKVAGGDRRVQL